MALPAMLRGLTSYAEKRIIIILLLGFSSGLPRLLVASTLSAWLADEGISKTAVGLFAFVALPYSFNFLWAPILDHIKLPILSDKMGRRRSWMILSQIALALSITALAWSNPAQAPIITAIAALCVAFFSASQDIIIDAYRTELLDKDQYGQGAAMAVFGYRLGMLVAGAGALFIADATNWAVTYQWMAAAIFVGFLTCLLAPEPAAPERSRALGSMSQRLKAMLITPFLDFAAAHKNWLPVLLLVLTYRIPDGFIGFMSTPFLLDIGFSKSEVASVGKLFGFGATIAGAIIGGALLKCWTLQRCLVLFLILQIFANLTYLWQEIMGADLHWLMLTISIDNLSGGMVTAAAIALLMSLTSLKHTATHYALLSSLASLPSIIMAGGAGWVAEHYGWGSMFALSALFGIPALLLLLGPAEISRHSSPQAL